MLNYNRFCGDKMIDKKKIEDFYDYFDKVADILYHNYQKAYIEGMNEAFNFLLDEDFKGEYSPEDNEQINKIRKRRSKKSCTVRNVKRIQTYF